MATGERPPACTDLGGDVRTRRSPTELPYSPYGGRTGSGQCRPGTADLAERVTGQKPLACFPAFVDLETFTADPPSPLPHQPSVAWIGVLEQPKDPLLLAEAWRAVVREIPEARLVVVGRGSMHSVIDDLARELPSQVRVIPKLAPEDVARLLDASTVLAISSRSEGLPRVILEAFLRGRPVVSRAVGGVRDLVEPERNGLLVEERNSADFAGALVRLLADRELAERLAQGARETAQHSAWSPAGYADAVRAMVDRVLDAP